MLDRAAVDLVVGLQQNSGLVGLQQNITQEHVRSGNFSHRKTMPSSHYESKKEGHGRALSQRTEIEILGNLLQLKKGLNLHFLLPSKML